jgi:hypothetical protein
MYQVYCGEGMPWYRHHTLMVGFVKSNPTIENHVSNTFVARNAYYREPSLSIVKGVLA